MSGRSTAFAVAVGSVAGAIAAWVGSPAPPPPVPPSAALKPIVQAATALPAAPSTATPVSVQATAVASALEAAPLAASAAPPATSGAPAASAARAPAANANAAVAPFPAPNASLPSTKAELLKVEMHCDQRDAAACELAAAAYDQGSAGITDPAKAANYRKIALTHWLSQCDKNSATACITLAGRYRVGAGVPQSERNADALLERSRELCKLNPAAACADLPKSDAH